MKKRLRQTKNKQPRPAAQAARRDYVRELEFQLRSYRQTNEQYWQTLARVETAIHLKDRQTDM